MLNLCSDLTDFIYEFVRYMKFFPQMIAADITVNIHYDSQGYAFAELRTAHWHMLIYGRYCLIAHMKYSHISQPYYILQMNWRRRYLI